MCVGQDNNGKSPESRTCVLLMWLRALLALRRVPRWPLLEVEVRVSIAGDLLIALGMHNLLDLVVDEVVERVDVLLHQAPHLRQVTTAACEPTVG